ncbi:MAG: RnfABCDGE type electron transport complex subunit B [Oscillospiraceae bacterium]
MFESYILPVIIFAVMGAAAGILLTIVSKIFAVKTDERIEAVNEALPQVNCGACGFSGCSDYAKAIVEQGAAANLCKPGGTESAEKIAEIMGVKAESAVPSAAVVLCSGDCDSAKQYFVFGGVQSCAAAKRFYGGEWQCKYGCLGFGDCAGVCPVNAISVNNGVASVDPKKCIGCGLCTKTCPNNIIVLRSLANRVDVRCSSQDMGKLVRGYCSNGCIGCKICEKQCEFDAIHVENNLARIDYSKCTSCGKCAEKCPSKIIRICGEAPLPKVMPKQAQQKTASDGSIPPKALQQ